MPAASPRKLPLQDDDEESRDRGMNQGGHGGRFSWLTALGFTFLTFNSGMAIYRSQRDPGSVAFVVVSYLDLVLLFACLRIFERTPRESPRRGWLKVCVWGLTTLLTVMFSHKVAAIMPPLVALVVWAMAFATIGGGFYAFFIHGDKTAQLEEAGNR
ncbi:uncharacterized protein LOC112889725 [Panicum hallii]|uniref:uncharacterized protein LOC112889725 n=1 Tax=Panicum hallii TaxID=206008 RepID=UPI000DF4CB9A|nr:uncharacterized protein LOC112889725 [Panicum hallii]XP_025812270.1 uncharacterized protein LOC112889725 [Panicum hallii]XP_025812271.1 uncharacterized protein LOC112889725 [Panicum hallii]